MKQEPDAIDVEEAARAYLSALHASCGPKPTQAQREEFHRLKIERAMHTPTMGRSPKALLASLKFSLEEVRRRAEEIESGSRANPGKPN